MNLEFLSGRRIAPLLGFVACASAIAFAYVLQFGFGLEPCPMCIFQRIAVVFSGVFFLLWAMHGPPGFGRYVYAVGAVIGAIGGMLIAGRHVWLQNLPEDQVPACGPTLDYLMDVMPAMEVIQMVLRGDGNCAKIDASFLGLSIPAWTFVFFVALTLWAVISIFQTRRGASASAASTPNEATP